RVDRNWTGGGNDYGGCGGSGVLFDDSGNIRATIDPTPAQSARYAAAGGGLGINRGGFFVDNNTRIADITDGPSQVVMAGEVMRLTGRFPHHTEPWHFSSDGWAWGGAATIFSCRFGINKGIHYDNAGSSHPSGIAQFVYCDGSVHSITQNINQTVYENL